MKHKLPEHLITCYYNEAHCLEAVKQDGYELKYVKVQTPEICLAAVNQDGESTAYVKEQTLEIILAALEDYPNAIKFIDWDVLTPEEFEYIKLKCLN